MIMVCRNWSLATQCKIANQKLIAAPDYVLQTP
jgi:hypothetical protein